MRGIALVLITLAACTAQETRVQLDPAATKVNWVLGDVLHTVRGTFKLKRGDLWFDSTSGKAGGQLVVDAASGDSGSSARDSRMHKNILESGKFPEITFVPDRIEGPLNPKADSDVRLHGMFTIHGGTHEVTMKVHSHFDGSRVTATAAFAVPYVAWGMKNPSTFILRVNDTVEISIDAVGRVQ